MGVEGIMAKDSESTYVSKRSRSWLKIKTHQRQEVVIGGFTKPRGSRKKFGALVVGVYEKGSLIYVGHVGGGFDVRSLEELFAQFEPLITPRCPFKVKPKTNMAVTWVKPQLVCEVSFQEWTKEGIMRQPIFLGLRDDKSPKTVKRELPHG
jgi:bifunctional non-homologous end joining protein LigD